MRVFDELDASIRRLGAGVLDCFHSVKPAKVGVPQVFYKGCAVSVWGKRGHFWNKRYVKIAELKVAGIQERTKQIYFDSPLPKTVKCGDLILLGSDTGLGLNG